uniref:FCP1 homology domain-containing protein n=1 Tax=Corethron hystrix TaxID=216773 RepID=A0A7S1C1Y3_9STRA|mmetsp:Transcript_9126/g.20169  ORF Transcript_9126/g.20169 Transcript_9126/m.20169 type:complete len:174 (+) Transcript_9126:127-648(+)
MRVIFLDIDGVMLPFGSGREACDGTFSDVALAALSRILEETGAEICLSSTWRCAGGQREILRQFGEYGRRRPSPLTKIAAHGFKHTTSLTNHTFRQHEIYAWVIEQQPGKIESWCALDDEELVSCDEIDGGGEYNARHKPAFAPRAIKTESHVGLTDEKASAAIAALFLPFQT